MVTVQRLGEKDLAGSRVDLEDAVVCELPSEPIYDIGITICVRVSGADLVGRIRNG